MPNNFNGISTWNASSLWRSAGWPIRSIIAIFILGITASGCTGVQLKESDLFLPKASITAQDFPRGEVTLVSKQLPAADPGIQLETWHLTPPSPTGAVLFFGGNGFYLVQSSGYVDALTGQSLEALMFDYRGYGRSGGEPSVEALKADALVVYDYVVDSLGVDPSALHVHGHSLGTFVALYVATERPVRGVVLENPASNVDSWRKSVLPWFLRLFIRLKPPESLQDESNTERIAQLDVPVLIIAGGQDPITPPSMAEELCEAAPADRCRLLVLEEGGHNELYEDERYQQTYRAWLSELPSAPLTSSTGQSRPSQ